MQASNLLLLLEGSCPENVFSDSDMDIWTTWADGICLWHKTPTNLTFVTNVIGQHYWAISKPYNIIRCNWCDNVKLIIFITNLEPKFSGVGRLCSVMINNILLLIITEHCNLLTPENFGSRFVIKIMSFTLSHQLHLGEGLKKKGFLKHDHMTYIRDAIDTS